VIRGIVFDCFGVLCHGSLDYLRSITPSQHIQELNDLSHSSDYGYISRAEYAGQVGKLTGHSSKEIDEIIKGQRIRNERIIHLAKSLRPAYKVAMLSNVGRGVMNELFSAKELHELFDVVILSSEAGVVKPDTEAYELTIGKLNLQPEECVMIDDLSVNISGARAAGMHGILCAGTDQLETDLRQLLETNA
jgi:epoxide hydrolase-like predicted phosphatase